MRNNEASIARNGMEVAVIGMSGHFPGAKNLEEFWDNLKNGIESISFFTDEELISSGVDKDIIKNPNYVRAKGILEDVEYFDASFFGYSPRDAEAMDPQLRIFHECAWEALENAGYDTESYKGLIGLYAGASSNFIWEALGNLRETEGSAIFEAGMLNDKDYLNSNISYKLNLKGPSLSVFTACSTNLVAIHIACQDLLNGGCDMALAGGVSIALPQKSGYIYQEGMINSPDGHCRAFDASAKGTVSGNGVGCVILKRLDDAINDGDYIYAIIKGSAINNDGADKVSFSSPSVKGQADVIRTAQQMAEVSCESVSYIETHGTGTIIGDPIEIEALKLAFGTEKKGFCAIGSVKSNIGHLDSAAGIASFIKTVLAIHNKMIPPNINYETANPHIDFENSPFYVNTKLTEWNAEDLPIRAGVTSLGMGGTNAHIVLEEMHKLKNPTCSRRYKIIMLSAKSQLALEKQTENLKDYLSKNENLELSDIAYTLQVGRRSFNYKKMLVCSDTNEVINTLNSENSRNVYTSFSNNDSKEIIFMFPGQGSQYLNMGFELYQNESIFREELDKCFIIIEQIMGINIKDIVYPIYINEEIKQKIISTTIAQPLILSFEYALAKLLITWGIKPNAMIGYSFGEYTAACISGVFSLEDALKLTIIRGKLMDEIPEGRMLSIPLTEEQLKPFLNDTISLAVVNGTSCIVSGEIEDVDAFEEQMRQNKYICTYVPVSHASHCAVIDTILEKFESYMQKIRLNAPHIPYISSITGKWITKEEATSAKYWVTHLRETVRFVQGLDMLVQSDNTIFIEVGPGQDLSALARRCVGNNQEERIIPLVKHQRNNITDSQYLLTKIGLLWLNGIKINWSEFYKHEKRHRIPLPTYPFERQYYWRLMDNYVEQSFKSFSKKEDIKVNSIDNWYYKPSWKYMQINLNEKKVYEKSFKWLIFLDKDGIGEGLHQELEIRNQKVVCVNNGLEFKKFSNNQYIINSEIFENYIKLFDELRRDDNIPQKIIHLWSIYENTSSEKEIDYFKKAQNLGLYSLINIVKCIDNYDVRENTEIQVVTNNVQDITGEEKLSPEKATLQSACVIIPQEYNFIKCRYIDIDTPENKIDYQNKLVKQLILEFGMKEVDTAIAYRKNRRLVHVFDKVTIDSVDINNMILKNNGVYFITGGLGNIAFSVAEYIAKKVNAKVVLIGRSFIPEKDEWQEWLSTHDINDSVSIKVKKLMRLEELGAELLVISADVANEDQMKMAVSQTLKAFGNISGVVFAAGILEGESIDFISRIEKHQFDIQFQAKVYGMMILEKVLESINLDFCAVFSSLSSIFCEMCEVAYSAANIFADYFVYRHNKISETSWVSINWDTWKRDESSSIINKRKKFLDDYIMSHDEAIEAMMRILSNRIYGQVAVTKEDIYTRIDERMKLLETRRNEMYSKKQIKEFTSRPNIINPYVPPRNETESILVAIWEQFFGMKKIGIQDDFFELGGDSLKGITMLSEIHKAMNVKLPIIEVFKWPTIEGFARLINNASHDEFVTIQSAGKKLYYDLSSEQKRMFVLNQLEKESTNYNMPAALIVEGELNIGKVEKALQTLVDRHESLRTTFEMIDGKVVQIIHDKMNIKLEYHEDEYSKINLLINNFIKPFDLKNGPLIRSGIIKVGNARYIFMIDTHHIISDGVSTEIIVKEFSMIYTGKKLQKLRLHYKDYSEWQRKTINDELLVKQEQYWVNILSGDLTRLNITTDYKRPTHQSFEGARIDFNINKELSEKVKKLGYANGATLYMTLLAAYNVLLYKYSGQNDIIIGSPIFGRNHPDLQNIIGMFVNTLVMRNYPKGEKTFKGFLQEVKKTALGAFENKDYQFDELIVKLGLIRDLSRNVLFDTVFALENMNTEEIEAKSAKFKPYNFQTNTTKFDLTLTACEKVDEIQLRLEYSTRLFKKETVERIASHFLNILKTIVENPEVLLSQIDMISEEEKRKILVEFNDTKVEYPKDKTIHELFEEQVENTPDNNAVVYQDKKLTYRELNEKSNQLARVLREKGVGSDSIVGIMVERSLEMIIGIMGILKAGGAYLPIDPEYPKERIEYMLEDSKTKVLLTKYKLAQNINFIEEIIDFKDTRINSKESCNLSRINTPQNLAYIIYTSGTTGKPKGTMIEHKNVVRLMFNEKMLFDFNDKDVWTMFHSYCFDFSVWEMYGALLYGGRLVIIPRDVAIDSKAFLSLLKEERVTVLNQIPTPFYSLMEKELNYGARELDLRYIIFGGEALKPEMLKQWIKKYPETKLINMYGITETTVHVTYKSIGEEEINQGISNIGKPIPTLTTYIMDKNLKLLPIGVPGELCVGGDGVGRGYLNKKELTEEKFISNPYKTEERIYRSGDLGRWLPDGNIEYIGRIDHQVKIRGFRIELGEIENQLLKNELIKEAIVVDKEDKQGNKYLCAYIVSDEEMTVPELRKFLSKELPEYMIPAYFMQIEKIPLTPNGKIDRKALHEPDGEINTGVEYTAPRNEIEEKLVKVWSEVLGIEKIGIDDDFFSLGGHSLMATVTIGRMHKELNVEVPLKEMFRLQTVRKIGEYITIKEKSFYEDIKIIKEQDYYITSSAQKRIYFLSQMEKANINYNIPILISIEGRINKEKIEQTFNNLIKRHEMLRSSFEIINGEVVQKENKAISFSIEYFETKGDEVKRIIDRFIRPFDLSEAPLFRVGIIKTAENSNVIMIDIHHIIADGESIKVIVREFKSLYKGMQLPPLKIRYKDYAAWQQQKIESENLSTQQEYWLSKLSGEIPDIRLPIDYPDVNFQGGKGANIRVRLENDYAEKLLKLASESKTMLHMVLFSAYNILLFKYSGQEDIIVGIPVAGRQRPELENVIGMFVNTLALRNNPSNDMTFYEFLITVKDNILEAYENQDYPFDEIVKKLNIKRSGNYNPIFSTMFAYEKEYMDEFEISDLKFDSYQYNNESIKFTLLLTAIETGESIDLNLEYPTAVFKKSTAEKIMERYINILKQVALNANVFIRDINLIAELKAADNSVFYEDQFDFNF